MGNPKISVIVPAYNEEKYLPVMLDCVMRQSLQEFEIIIVNDGSSDATQKIIDSFVSRSPSKVFCIAQKNQGLSASRNNAMKIASGEYVAFLDADDLIADNYLEKLYSAAKKEDADIAKCSYIDFDNETGKTLCEIDAVKRTVEFEPGYKYVFQYCAWAGIYRLAFLRRYEILFSVGEQMEDSPFSLTAHPLANRVAVVGDYLYSHRMHSGSIMANVKDAKKDPKIPYKGFESAVRNVRKYLTDPVRLEIADYCFVRVLSDYATERYKTQGKGVRRKLCDYFKNIMNQYFPDIMENRYLFGDGKSRISSLPLFEREAVRLFALSWKTKLIYPFSSVSSFALRVMNK